MPNKQSAGADFGHKSSSILRGLRGAKVVARWGEDDGQPQGLTRVGVFLGRTSIPQQRAATRANPFQLRRVASQTKPLQECHPERSEGSLSGQRSFAALRMTKRDGLLVEMYWLATRAPHTIPRIASPHPRRPRPCAIGDAIADRRLGDGGQPQGPLPHFTPPLPLRDL